MSDDSPVEEIERLRQEAAAHLEAIQTVDWADYTEHPYFWLVEHDMRNAKNALAGVIDLLEKLDRNPVPPPDGAETR